MPGATPAAGVIREHPLRRKTAGLRGVAPGITGGVIPRRPLLRKGRSVQQARGGPSRRPGRRHVHHMPDGLVSVTGDGDARAFAPDQLVVAALADCALSLCSHGHNARRGV